MAQGEKANDGGVDDLMGFLEGLVREWRERATTDSPMTLESIEREIIALADQIQRGRRGPEGLPPGIDVGTSAACRPAMAPRRTATRG